MLEDPTIGFMVKLLLAGALTVMALGFLSAVVVSLYTLFHVRGVNRRMARTRKELFRRG